MYIFTNAIDFSKISFEDIDDLKYERETIFCTFEGVFKKYKEHYYKLNYEENEFFDMTIENINILVQKNDTNIIKSNPLTSLPFDHYCIDRKTYMKDIDEYIKFVQEIDNDVFVSNYFIVSDTLTDYSDILLRIGVFLKNIMHV